MILMHTGVQDCIAQINVQMCTCRDLYLLPRMQLLQGYGEKHRELCVFKSIQYMCKLSTNTVLSLPIFLCNVFGTYIIFDLSHLAEIKG